MDYRPTAEKLNKKDAIKNLDHHVTSHSGSDIDQRNLSNFDQAIDGYCSHYLDATLEYEHTMSCNCGDCDSEYSPA